MLAFGMVATTNVGAQAPFNGMYVEEVPIPAGVFAEINAAVPGAKMYHGYVCVSEPFWELQAIFGYNVYPLDLTISAGAEFYQNFFGGPTSKSVNPSFFPFVPALQYDSFLTIGRLSDSNNQLGIITDPTLPFFWYDNFESNGGGLLFADPVGTSLVVAVNRSLPVPMGGYNDQNIPTADNNIVIFQFVTNGIFQGHFNFQFRRLNADYSVYLPVQASSAYNVYITNTPGVQDLPCALVFLPVGITHFAAEAIGPNVSIQWVTESEVNNDFFTVERSKDGEKWEFVTTMPGAGNSSTQRNYSAIDSKPYEGMSYYRLKQTDFDGNYEYSDKDAVEFYYPSGDYGIYPNPSTGTEVFVQGRTEDLLGYKLFGPDGKLLLEKRTNGEPFYGVEIEKLNLPAGMYVFEFIRLNGESQRERLVVN
jgi:hypothetical protein